MSKKSEAYDRLYPGVDISEAQKEERMDRKRLQGDLASHRTTMRSRFVTVPAMPWLEKGD